MELLLGVRPLWFGVTSESGPAMPGGIGESVCSFGLGPGEQAELEPGRC